MHAGWLVPCGCCRSLSSAAHPAQSRTCLWHWKQQRGAVWGGPGHLAGPLSESLSFILLINTIYFICLAGLCLSVRLRAGTGCAHWGLLHVVHAAMGMGVPGGGVV